MSGILSGLVDSIKLLGKGGFQLGKGFIIDESGKVIQPSDISGAKVGFPSQTVDTVQNIPRTTPLNFNVLAGSTAATAASIGGALVFTNTGFQNTASSFAPGFNSLADTTKSLGDVAKNTSNFLTSSQYGPILLIGGLIVIGLMVFKK